MGIRQVIFARGQDHGGEGYYSRNLGKFIYYRHVRMHDNNKIWKHKRRLQWSEKYRNACLTNKRKFMYSHMYLIDMSEDNPKLNRWLERWHNKKLKELGK